MLRGGAVLGSVLVAALFRDAMLLLPAIVVSLSWDTSPSRRSEVPSRPTKADLRLLEDPDDPDICLVLVEVIRNGESVGTDRGAAWFANGLLLYSGHRTSFAIGGQDVLTESASETMESDVRLRVHRGYAVLRILPLVANGGGPQDMRFLKRLYAFRRRPDVAEGSRQWPPFEPWSEPTT